MSEQPTAPQATPPIKTEDASVPLTTPVVPPHGTLASTSPSLSPVTPMDTQPSRLPQNQSYPPASSPSQPTPQSGIGQTSAVPVQTQPAAQTQPAPPLPPQAQAQPQAQPPVPTEPQQGHAQVQQPQQSQQSAQLGQQAQVQLHAAQMQQQQPPHLSQPHLQPHLHGQASLHPQAQMHHSQAQSQAAHHSMVHAQAMQAQHGHAQVQPMAPAQVQAQAAAPSKVKFESALDFLEKVKTVFEDKPGVYAKFLDIMKEFKAHAIDTPGVILRVKYLFQGHPDLILGFNTFLPPGYKITHADLDTPLPEQQDVRKPELDHARSYVKKIKVRFANEPHIYKAFLEILHTYHKEKHPIQDVYNQVARLFRDHADLLTEFFQFLPDPNARMPTPAELAARDKEMEKTRQPAQMLQRRSASDVRARDAAISRQQAHNEEAQRRSRRAQAAKPAVPPRTTPSAPRKGLTLSFADAEQLVRVKIALGDRNWREFIKLLDLFNNDVLTRPELLYLARDLLNQHSSLLHWLRRLVGVDESELSDDEPFLGGLDLQDQPQAGPSYRKRPPSFLNKETSARSELDRSVLNDDWISRPTGEEGGSFKNALKNEWEEQLFRCEDDRFEWDVQTQRLHSLAAAMRALQSDSPQPLSALHVSALRTLYAPRSDEVLSALSTNPKATAGIVQARIAQKLEEWARLRQSWSTKWAAVQKMHWQHSHDHASHHWRLRERSRLAPTLIRSQIRQAPLHTTRFDFSDEDACAKLRACVALLIRREHTNAADRERLDRSLLRFLDLFCGKRFANAPPSNLLTALPPTPTPSDEAAAVHVRPVTVDGEGEPLADDRTHRVCYGSGGLYVLLCMLHELYDRIILARKHAAKPDLKRRFPPPMQQPAPAQGQAPTNDTPPAELEPLEGPPPGEERYKAYCTALERLCAGLLEDREFELEARSLIGLSAEAVPALVMDRLAKSIAVQLTTVLQHTPTQRLLAVYLYQQCRVDDQSKYRHNVSELLRGKHVYRIVFDEAKGSCEIQLLEPGSLALEAAGEKRDDMPPRPDGKSAVPAPYARVLGEQGVHSQWDEHVRTLLHSISSEYALDDVFLRRNVEAAARELGNEPLRNTLLINGLACRVDAQSLRPHYVDSTEDIFWRRREHDRPRRPSVGKRSLDEIVAIHGEGTATI